MLQHAFNFPNSAIETPENRTKYVQKDDFRGLLEIPRLQNYGKTAGLLLAAYC